MKIGGAFDLTYCSNIHAGEAWSQVSSTLATSLPRIRELLSHEGPFGIGLRLSAAAARELESPETLERFRAFLRDGDYYVPTINGFPYGAFHGTRVKERVYLPDWRSDERVDYTNRLARILAVLVTDRLKERRPGVPADAKERREGVSADPKERREGVPADPKERREGVPADSETTATISTVPGAFRQVLRSDGDVAAMARNVLRHAAFLKRLHADTGVKITLAIEPEPACHMETVDDAVRFFQRHLLDTDLVSTVARESASDLSAEDVVRYVGVCLDTCHMAVEFEDPRAAFEQLRGAGISAFKVQLSSALRLAPAAERSPRALLERFADDTYLHQVVTAGSRGLTRYTDLPEALSVADRDPDAAREEWRVHFHVPVFLAAMSGFDTTQDYLAGVLRHLRQTRDCRCLEVETYTWDVLPAEYRTSDVCTAIARELTWVRGVLNG